MKANDARGDGVGTKREGRKVSGSCPAFLFLGNRGKGWSFLIKNKNMTRD